MSFPETGEYVFPGGLATLAVDRTATSGATGSRTCGCERRLLIVGGARVRAAAPASAAKPAPEVLQARYDAGRDAEERALARGDRPTAARAHRDVAWAESFDTRPAGWRRTREVPHFGKPSAARAERRRDARIAAGLEEIGRATGARPRSGTTTSAPAPGRGGTRTRASPAASLVKLGARRRRRSGATRGPSARRSGTTCGRSRAGRRTSRRTASSVRSAASGSSRTRCGGSERHRARTPARTVRGRPPRATRRSPGARPLAG